jgi:hypothetical protein
MLVLGMHRSGTSAVTRALAELGLDAGRDPLMDATKHNPTGHFEVGRLTGFDDELLTALGGRWAGPPPTDAEAAAGLAHGSLGDEARRLVTEVFPEEGWVWKDPRACLLLPFWRTVLVPEPVAIVVVRNPVAVARSLEARDGIAVGYGLALWERYTRTLLRDLAGMRAYVVDYDATMEDPRAQVDRIVAFLIRAGFDPAPFDAQAAAGAFVGDHRHQGAGGGDDVGDLSARDELRALHELVGGLGGDHDAFPTVDLGVETPRLQIAFTEHTRVAAHEERANLLEAEIALRDSQISDLRLEVERRSAQAGELATDVMALREEQASLSGRLIRLEGWFVVRARLKLQEALERRRGRRASRGGGRPHS